MWIDCNTKRLRVKHRKSAFLFLLGVLTILYFSCPTNVKVFRQYPDDNPNGDSNHLNPPQVDQSILRSKAWNSDPREGMKMLSNLVHEQIINIQRSGNCKRNIFCGHANDCGFGCQIHHRAACLMISYAMGLPLIHDAEIGFKWAFSTPWTDLMLPIGSNCSVGRHTYKWTWYHSLEFYSTRFSNSNFSWNISEKNEIKRMGFPLYDGIVVSTPLADLVERLNPNPVMWWINQFVEHAMRIKEDVIKKIRKDQKRIGFRSECIGFHVRRTDKFTESVDSFHQLHEYFNIAKKLAVDGRNLSVFIASDDSSILPAAKRRYADWEVIGFRSNLTKHNYEERKDFAYEILRDIVTLSECEKIVCGYSSNVCRLVFELRMFKKATDISNFVSLDGTYKYLLWGVTLKPKINKFDIF